MGQPAIALLIDASQPFSQSMVHAAETPATAARSAAPALFLILVATWAFGFAVILGSWCVRWRRIARLVRDAPPVGDGPAPRTLHRLEAIAGVTKRIAMVSSAHSIEPGVFGILNPVLIWPRDIGERLGASEVEAILAHEVCHVRRHDNLAALGHMVVQAVCWFHPLVWWIGGRLVDERERACDEDVIRLGTVPRVYAESILKTCQFYLQSSPAFVAGVTGADLTMRIERIMKNRTVEQLNSWRRALLTMAALGSLAIPVVVGAMNAPRLSARSPQENATGPTFEVASVKPNNSGDGRTFAQNQPGRFTATNVTLRLLIRNAYQLQDFQITGGPSWISSDHFDVVAKIGEKENPLANPFPTKGTEPTSLQLMIRALLAERFKLAVHTETQQLPIYSLVVARNDGRLGPNLHRSETDCSAALAAGRGRGAPPAPPQAGEPMPCGMRIGPGAMSMGAAPLSQFASSLSMFVGRVVLDRTGLTGVFDANLTWTPEQMPQRASGTPADQPLRFNGVDIDPNGPSIFTAVQEQLGLKLESQKGPVDVLVIDRVEHPVEN
jgi:uncharacterized protein (TIGR03435 family)